MELNVKQSGIEERILVSSYFKTKAGRVFRRAHERYLRNDISCGHCKCDQCALLGKNTIGKEGTSAINSNCPFEHAIIVDCQTFIRFFDLFDSELLKNVIITQGVWEFVRNKSIVAFKKMNALCYEEVNERFFVFMSEFHHKTYVPNVSGVSEEQRLEKMLNKSASFLSEHWGSKCVPIVLCADDAVVSRVGVEGVNAMTIKHYVEGLVDEGKKELLNKMMAYEKNISSGVDIFEEHLSHDEIVSGFANGTIKKGNFTVSRENYKEANVLVDPSTMTSWFVQGMNCNRAMNGDTVAVRLLPEDQWSAPAKKIVLRDVEEINMNADDVDDDAASDCDEPSAKKVKKNVIPTAKVVGIVKRNWRPYCGILLPSIIKGRRKHLFCPTDRLLPRIRIETEQADILAHQRIVVQVDQWPRDSKYPLGHYVRTVGNLGDRETENEVLLLEHDIPHAPFSEEVLACLPQGEWIPNIKAPRVDLRDLTVCSVDPPGCTDIDDALHCRALDNGLFEVGVHIADVTNFVRPGTAIDQEAANRGTTVYLCDRRIDMLPELLSGNLCSLRGGVERYAFSVIWTMTSEAEIVSAKYHKSLIRSKAALTYKEAQERIDDSSKDDDVTLSLRGLMKLSKVLKNKRTANGALTLASSEIRFDMDWETRTPKAVLEKEALDTNSMVEEFMLLANISVAEKILAEYPDCALLRRHPVPTKDSYKTVIEAAANRGFDIKTDSGKALADSLNRAVDSKNPMLNRLLRMLTTRCMTQAVYFSAGTIPVPQYLHFGLACPIYTHFTSPIRRYADVIVHRLLAAAIGADDIAAGLLQQSTVKNVSANINYRHKQAQYAGRASVQLNVLTFFKGREEEAEGFVMGIRSNGIQVFVPKYGLESIIVLQEGFGTVIDLDNSCVRAGNKVVHELDKVVVKVSLDEKNVQRPRIQLKLLQPPIAGLSVDFDLSSEIGVASDNL
ncbi:unnamed protein product [Auanema sp. JU1783]|nr:unnamed protein product [Auanema sp. JU1783]